MTGFVFYQNILNNKVDPFWYILLNITKANSTLNYIIKNKISIIVSKMCIYLFCLSYRWLSDIFKCGTKYHIFQLRGNHTRNYASDGKC